METRRNHLLFASLCIVVGVVMFGFGSLVGQSGGDNLRKCPVCAESIQPDARKCRFCGNDLPESRHRPLCQNPRLSLPTTTTAG